MPHLYIPNTSASRVVGRPLQDKIIITEKPSDPASN